MADTETDDFELTTNVPERAEPEPVASSAAPASVQPAAEAQPPAAEAATAEPEPEAEPGRDRGGRFRHRAKSQQARAEDVPRINELTAKLRQAEAELQTLRAGASPRAEARPMPAAPGPPPTMPALPPTRPKPTEDEVGGKYPAYSDFTEDLAAWKYEQLDQQREALSRERQRVQTETERVSAYQAKVAVAKRDHPDFDTVVQGAQVGVSPSMHDAIMTSDQSAEIVYYLATHQDECAELARDTADSPVSAAPILRKFLESRLVATPRLPSAAAAVTGSVPGGSSAPVPRPPNPVRTGPTPWTDRQPPGDDASLEEHERYYTRPRRVGRR